MGHCWVFWVDLKARDQLVCHAIGMAGKDANKTGFALWQAVTLIRAI